MALRPLQGRSELTPAATMRDDLANARRVVIKVGSSSLTTADGGIDPQRIEQLVGVLARARRRVERLCSSHPVRLQRVFRPSGSSSGPGIWQLSRLLHRSVKAY